MAARRGAPAGLAGLAAAHPRIYEVLRQMTNAIDRLSRGNPRGEATLVAGTVTVPNAVVVRDSLIQISRITSGGTAGHLAAPKDQRLDRKSFVISSSSATDTSTVVWEIIG